jgi:hypothetical protein
MNKSYNQNLYEFITDPENFESYSSLINISSDIRQQLLTEFWKNVLKAIEARPNEFKDWKSYIYPESVMDRYSSLGLYSDKYYSQEAKDSSALICFERLHSKALLGCWFNRADKKMNTIFENAVIEAEKFRTKDYSVGTGGYWFVCYKLINEDFNNTDSLSKILPVVREPLVKQYSELLIQTFKDLKELIEKFGVEVENI